MARAKSQFVWHEAAESIATPPWMGNLSITGLPQQYVAANHLKPWWRETIWDKTLSSDTSPYATVGHMREYPPGQGREFVDISVFSIQMENILLFIFELQPQTLWQFFQQDLLVRKQTRGLVPKEAVVLYWYIGNAKALTKG